MEAELTYVEVKMYYHKTNNTRTRILEYFLHSVVLFCIADNP